MLHDLIQNFLKVDNNLITLKSEISIDGLQIFGAGNKIIILNLWEHTLMIVNQNRMWDSILDKDVTK